MVSPYLNRPLRSLDEVLQARAQASRTYPERRTPVARAAAHLSGELALRHVPATAPRALPEERFVEAPGRREAA